MTGPRAIAKPSMKTIGGMSVRSEIDARLEAAQLDTRAGTFDEAIAFLGGSGFAEAAEALRHAVFDEQEQAVLPSPPLGGEGS